MTALFAFTHGLHQSDADYRNEQNELQRQILARDYAARCSRDDDNGTPDRSPLTYVFDNERRAD